MVTVLAAALIAVLGEGTPGPPHPGLKDDVRRSTSRRRPDGEPVLLRAAILAAVLLAGAPCAATKPPGSAPAGSLDDLFALVLHRALIDPKNLQDSNLSMSGPEILVRSSIGGSSIVIGEKALPQVPGKKLVLLSDEEIQSRAAQKGDFYVVAVSNLELRGDEAEFNIGTQMVISPASHSLSMCCCTETVIYTRAGGKWKFKESAGTICA
jgi:hypothetical protein